MTEQPTINRIASLDVLRGFALLGILLLNILGFGLIAAAYSNPAVDLLTGSTADQFTWATVELFAEGAMRCLFSILFGAGVMLFATGERAKSAKLYYKRTFWLLMFGLFDAYILLWNGDILVTYAISGAILYWCRNLSVKQLSVTAAVILGVISLQYGLMGYGLNQAFNAHTTLQNLDPTTLDSQQLQGLSSGSESWQSFTKDFKPTQPEIASEIAARTASYGSAFSWNLHKSNEMISFVVPVFMIWDALVMMIIGMVLFKAGVLQATRSQSLHIKMMVFGFGIGLLTNGFEVTNALASNFELIGTFAQLQPTYHLGRLAMAIGYIGLILWLVKGGYLTGLTRLLACTGKMALTNYLMHAFIALLIFTGMGLGLLGQVSRSELYPIVLGIWIFQLFASQYWLARFHFGPVEWLWRGLTYGKFPEFIRR